MTFVSCLGAACASFSPLPALACGGCFHGPPPPMVETAVVTGHRMAYAISPDRTVLWDQIKYQGPPQDFAWVLPVKPGATLELSRDAWFESLDSATSTQVTQPKLNCANNPSGGGGCACGGSAGTAKADTVGSAGPGFDPGTGVTVLHEETIGPYDTVTLRSTNGDSLSTWLATNGYQVPSDIAPTIAAYVSEGFDFIALRLSPLQNVQAMQPVRVVTPGPEGPLPLRMVAAGVGESVDIVLFVIGENRYALPDLNEVFLDTNALSWDFVQSSSNYSTLRAQALAQNLRYSYLTTFSDRGAFNKTYLTPSGGLVNYYSGGQYRGNLADLYFAQSAADAGVPPSCTSVSSELDSTTLVSAPGIQFTCDSYDDISAAMIGQHPANVWLSRLELDLPREALNRDCIVKPGPSQTAVSNQLLALQISQRPSYCPEPVFESGVAGPSPTSRGPWLAAFAALALGRLRRRSKAS